jgi:Predicted membrane protein
MIKEKKSTLVRNESTSSTNSIDIKPSRGRKPKNGDLFDSENTTTQDALNSSSSSIGSLCDHSDSELTSFEGSGLYNGQCKAKTPNSFSMNGTLEPEKDVKSSPLNTPVLNGVSTSNNTNNKDNIATKKRLKSTVAEDADNESEVEETSKETNNKKRKLTDKDNKSRLKVDKEKTNNDRPAKDKATAKEKKKKERTNVEKKKKEKGVSEKKKKIPQPQQLGLIENGKVSCWDTANEKL